MCMVSALLTSGINCLLLRYVSKDSQNNITLPWNRSMSKRDYLPKCDESAIKTRPLKLIQKATRFS